MPLTSNYFRFADRIKILHFIGRMKPWLLNFNSQTRIVYTPQESGYLHPYLQFWWDLFCDNVHEKLTEDMVSEIFILI